jgi:thiamine-phosphate pyrophosphorylase
MIPGDLTEAASRAITTVTHDTRSVHPHDLLWALLDQESRASEILASGGLDIPTIAACIPRPSDDAQTIDEPADAALDAVLLEAGRLAGRAGRGSQIGTEHLLWGLAQADETIGGLLAEHGLQAKSLVPAVEAAAGAETTPLETDETLAPAADNETDILRLVDATANRAREGLRVVEDISRFILEDPHLTGLLKQLRHDLVTALEPLDSGRLLTARDTLGDVGTTATTDREFDRGTLRDVLDANLGRAQESLRTLEEFAKLLDDGSSGTAITPAARFQSARYDLYTLHKALAGTFEARRRLDGRTLYVLATEDSCHAGIGPAIRAAALGGAGVVQLREKSVGDRQLLSLAHRVRRWTREAGTLFVINDRADLAVIAGADGVHVGQDELDVRSVRRIVGPDRLVGVSTHSIEQARQAVLDGADYLGVGPVFPSATKSFDNFAGLDYVRAVAEEISLPWYAIGGITSENLSEVIAAGASRIAVSAAVCAAEDPEAAARALCRELADDDRD